MAALVLVVLPGSCQSPGSSRPRVPPSCRYVFEPAAANKEEVKKAVREMRGR